MRRIIVLLLFVGILTVGASAQTTTDYTDLDPVTSLDSANIYYQNSGTEISWDSGDVDSTTPAQITFTETVNIDEFRVEACNGYGGTTSSEPAATIKFWESDSKANNIGYMEFDEFSGQNTFACENKTARFDVSGPIYMEYFDQDDTNDGYIDSFGVTEHSTTDNTGYNFLKEEDGDVSEWTGDGQVAIDSGLLQGSTYSVRMNTDGTRQTDRVSIDSGYQQASNYSFYAGQTGDASNNEIYFMDTNSDSSSSTLFGVFLKYDDSSFDRDDGFYYSNIGNRASGDALLDSWDGSTTKVKFSVDWANEEVTIYIGGVDRGTYNFFNSGSSANYAQLACNAASTDNCMTYDNGTIVTSASPANFQVDASSQDTYEGEDIDFEVQVENTGDTQATKEVNVSIAGTVRDAQNVTLNGGETKNITLTHTQTAGDTAGNYFYTVESPDDSDGVSHTILERIVNISNVSPADSSSYAYWEAVDQGITFSWDVAPTPEGTEYDTSLQLPNSITTITDTVSDTKSFTETLDNDQTGSISWTASADLTTYTDSASVTRSLTIEDPRHEIISTSNLSSVRMVNTTEKYNYTAQYEVGEQVNITPFAETFECNTSDPEYQSDGLCQIEDQKSGFNFDSVGTATITTEIEGLASGFTDSTSSTVDIYQPNATISGPEGDYSTVDDTHNTSLTWNSQEEAVTAYLYFNGNQIANETLQPTETMTTEITGEAGSNQYYYEVVGETSGDSYTFSTDSFTILEAGLDISLDETSFGNDQPLADTDYFYTGSDDTPPFNVSDGSYRLPYQTTSWSSTDEATYYGWITMDIPSGSSEVTDNLLNEEIAGNVTGSPVTGEISVSFNQLDSSGNVTITLNDEGGSSDNIYSYSSGESRTSETLTFSSNLAHSNNLSLEVENNLDKELQVLSVNFDNVEDRPTSIFGEEFRTVKVERTLIDQDDLEFWFTIDGKNATGLVSANNVNPEFMEYRGWNADIETGIDRGGNVATWDLQNRKDTFGVPTGQFSYSASGISKQVPASINRNNNTYFFFDLSDRLTAEHIATSGTLHVQAGNEYDSVDFNYSSDVDFRDFKSSSNLRTLDTTLSFKSDSELVSDGEFVSPQFNPVITIGRDLEILDVLEPVEDPNGDSFDFDTNIQPSEATGQWVFRNVHSNDISLDTNLSLGVSDPTYQPDDYVNITPTSDVAGSGGWTVRELLISKVEVREQLIVRDQMEKELDLDGSKLERGDLIITYKLEDQYQNFKEVERTFRIRENTIKGNLYQTLDNTFQFSDWLTGLLILLIVVVGGSAYIDLRLSLFSAILFAITASVVLLWSGILPFEINLIIMMFLAGIIGTMIMKVIG